MSRLRAFFVAATAALALTRPAFAADHKTGEVTNVSVVP